ncbi:HD domain-containing protein [Thermodesulfobacteriota bacterium]
MTDQKNIEMIKLQFMDDQDAIHEEIGQIMTRMPERCDTAFCEEVCSDTRKLFQGQYPGYRASNTKYHSLEHTLSVALAATRLMHGAGLEGHAFDPRNISLTFAATLFHDVGLIQQEGDVEGSGAKYTVGHEERSIAFAKKYLSKKGFSEDEQDHCAKLIRCTKLDLLPGTIPFPSRELETLGMIVGTADLLAQMADRYYLEKLLLLYQEFEEARLAGFDSELDLLKKTVDFYEIRAQKRFQEELGGVSVYMRAHFKDRWGMDRDLYDESIRHNIEYLKSLIAVCEESYVCYLRNLKRGGIAQKALASIKEEM